MNAVDREGGGDHTAAQLASLSARGRRLRTWTSTTFVGRDDLRDDLLNALKNNPLITLLGTGGVGKTRLAIEAALTVDTRRDDDCRPPGDHRHRPPSAAVAMLAEVQDTQGMLREIMSALGIVEHQRPDLEDVIVEHVHRSRDLLLVLDNAEHLRDAVGELVSVLLAETRHSGNLRIIVTSREALNIPGEQILPVPPLHPPRPGDLDQERVTPSAAVRLMQDRVQQHRGQPFGPDDDWTAILGLVAWSGGLPLIIELMASRLVGMTPRDMLTRLEDRRLALTARVKVAQAHHRALKTMLDWSAELCEEPERRLWARISVFVGGFSLEAAEEVCSGDGIERDEIAQLLDDLVNKSLVTLHTETNRYSQLQPLRDYGRDLLHAQGDTDRVRARHFDCVEGLAHEAARLWFGPDELEWLNRIGADVGNIRAALRYCLEPGSLVSVERGCLLAVNVVRCRAPFFYAWLEEWASWLEQLLAAMSPDPSEARIAGAAMLAWIRVCQGAPAQAKTLLDHGRSLIHSAGIAEPALFVIVSGAYLLIALAEEDFLPELTRAIDMLTGLDDFAGDRQMALMLRAMGAALLALPEAEEICQACLHDAEAHQAEWATSTAHWITGLVLLTQGKPYEAIALSQSALSTLDDMGDLWITMWLEEAIAWEIAATLPGTPLDQLYERATWLATLLGGMIGRQVATGVQLTEMVPARRARDTAIALTKQCLQRAIEQGQGDADDPDMTATDAYDRAFARGMSLDADMVYAMALTPQTEPEAGTAPTGPLPVSGPTLNELSPREREIVILVADGESNAEIARKSSRSERTIETTLANVYRKLHALGFDPDNKRAALAAWVTKQRAEQASDG